MPRKKTKGNDMKDAIVGSSPRGLETSLKNFFFNFTQNDSLIFSHPDLMNKSLGKIVWLNSEGLCLMGSGRCGPRLPFCLCEPTHLAYAARHMAGI